MWAWPGSCDHDNRTVQTAAMGQIPRSTERILVYHKFAYQPAISLCVIVLLQVTQQVAIADQLYEEKGIIIIIIFFTPGSIDHYYYYYYYYWRSRQENNARVL